MALLDNGDLIVSSYSATGIKIRAFTTSPFCKISKGSGPYRMESLSQSTLSTASGWTKDTGISQFIDLRYKWSLYKIYLETQSANDFCSDTDEADESGKEDECDDQQAFFRFDRRFFYANQK